MFDITFSFTKETIHFSPQVVVNQLSIGAFPSQYFAEWFENDQ